MSTEELCAELEQDLNNRLAVEEIARRHEITCADVYLAIGGTDVFKRWCRRHPDPGSEASYNDLSDADVAKIIELYNQGVHVSIITYREIDASPRKIEQKIKELHRLGVLPYRKKSKKEAV